MVRKELSLKKAGTFLKQDDGKSKGNFLIKLGGIAGVVAIVGLLIAVL